MNVLAEIKEWGKHLTKRQLEVLQIMADNEHDDYEGAIIYDCACRRRRCRKVYIGDTCIAVRTIFALLRACAISKSQWESHDIEYYYINETGKNILKAKRGGVGGEVGRKYAETT